MGLCLLDSRKSEAAGEAPAADEVAEEPAGVTWDRTLLAPEKTWAFAKGDEKPLEPSRGAVRPVLRRDTRGMWEGQGDQPGGQRSHLGQDARQVAAVEVTRSSGVLDL